MSDGDQPRGEWPRYDEREREIEATRGWIVNEVRRLGERIDDMKAALKEDTRKTAEWRGSMEARVAAIERTHDRDAAVKAWAGKVLAAFWIVVGMVASKALEYFLSHRPVVAAIGTSAVVMSASGGADAANYYVATTGDNTAVGTIDAPWRTITYASGNVAPGDIVTVANGTYAESLRTVRSGLPNARITFQAQTPGGVTLVAPVGNINSIGWESLGDYVTITGINIDGTAPATGVAWTRGIVASGAQAVVQGSTISNVGIGAGCDDDIVGILASGDSAIVGGNTVHGLGPSGC